MVVSWQKYAPAVLLARDVEHVKEMGILLTIHDIVISIKEMVFKGQGVTADPSVEMWEVLEYGMTQNSTACTL